MPDKPATAAPKDKAPAQKAKAEPAATPATEPKPPDRDWKKAHDAELAKSRKQRVEFDELKLQMAELRGQLKEREQYNQRGNTPAPTSLTEEDLAEPGSLEAKIKQITAETMASFGQQLTTDVDSRLNQSQQAIEDQREAEWLRREVGQYELANDPVHGRQLRANINYALYDEAAAGEKPTRDDIAAVIKEEVQKLSGTVADKSKPPGTNQEPPQPAPASAGGAVAQLKPGGDKKLSPGELVQHYADQHSADQQEDAAQGK
jgi:hypothetical protein